jgi:hypothetical protein
VSGPGPGHPLVDLFAEILDEVLATESAEGRRKLAGNAMLVAAAAGAQASTLAELRQALDRAIALAGDAR